jgi:chromosome segregation ATPase
MRIAAAFFFTVLLATNVIAQDKKGAQDAALRRLNAQNQRLASEKAKLERENAEAARALDSAQKDLQGQRLAAARNAKEAKRLGEELEYLEQETAAAFAREDELRQRLAETETALAAAREDAAMLRKRLANQTDTIGYWQAKTSECQAKNGDLAKLGYDLAERYRAKTCADIAVQNEPFTGIGRARMENLLEDYKEQLRAKRFDPRAEPAAKEAAK